MSIDINLYRFRIGTFLCGGKPRNKFRKSMKKNCCKFNLVLAALTLLSLNSHPPVTASELSLSSGSVSLKITSLSPLLEPSIEETYRQEISTFSWPHSCEINAIQHSLTGNKRNLGYRIATWNCNRGLLKNLQETDSDKLTDIKIFVEEYKPHLLGVIESDLHGPNSRAARNSNFTSDEIQERLKISGYRLELPDTWKTHDQARIIVYISDQIKSKKIDLNNVNFDLPSLTFEIGLGRERKTCVNFFYREWTSGVTGLKTQASQKDRIDRQVQHWKLLASRDRDLIILGDANLCAKSWNNTDYPSEKKQLANFITDFLLEESLVQLVNDFTRTELRGDRIERSCIDHIYSNCKTKCDEASVIVAGNSDHLAVMINKHSREIKQGPHCVKKRTYKNFCQEDFIREVKFTDFNEVTDAETSSEAAEKFAKIFNRITDNHAPVKIFQNRNNYAPWVSDGTKALMKERKTLKISSLESDDPSIMINYRKVRNKIKEINKKERIAYYGDKFKSAGEKNDCSQMWNLAYEILGSKKDLAPTQLNIEGRPSTNPKEMAVEFNKVFIKKVKNLRSKINGPVKVDPALRLQKWIEKRNIPIPELKFRKITEEELIKYIKRLKGNKSSGIDQIDSFLLKIAAPYMKDVLLHVINLSISSNFPDPWKIQLIRPNYKKGDRNEGENYRPVSNIPELSKMLEFAIFDQLFSHFIDNGLIHPNHHGFVPLHNTSTAIIQMYDLWLEAAEKQELSSALLLDLSAAFDLVQHSTLLDKLRIYNLSENSLSFMKSYLSNRKQVVQVETKISEPKDVGEVAVPQGSVLGGLLFLIFQNDFPENNDDEPGESVLYADDDTDIVSDKDPEILRQKIQNKADKSTEWYQDNGMICSGDKTKLLIMSTKELRSSKLTTIDRSIDIKVCNKAVKESVSERLLGLTVQNDLSWSAHLYGNGLSGKEKTVGLLTQLSQRVGILKRLKSFTQPKQFASILNGLFTSKMTYGIQIFGNVWGLPTMDDENRKFSSFTKEDNRRLQVLQNKVLRLKTGLDRYTPTNILVKTSDELSVQQLTAYHTLMTIFKAIRFKKPLYLSNKLELRQPIDNQVFPHRQLNSVYVKAGLTISRGGTLYRGAKLWNLLTNDLKMEISQVKFKSNVKKWIRENVPTKPP